MKGFFSRRKSRVEGKKNVDGIGRGAERFQGQANNGRRARENRCGGPISFFRVLHCKLQRVNEKPSENLESRVDRNCQESGWKNTMTEPNEGQERRL